MSFILQYAHLESALVCNIMMQSALYEIWLPHIVNSQNYLLLALQSFHLLAFYHTRNGVVTWTFTPHQIELTTD